MRVSKGRVQKKEKKNMEFAILSKTHPPHLPMMEKNNMVTTKGRVKKTKKKYG